MKKLILTCALLTSVTMFSYGQALKNGSENTVATNRTAPSAEQAATTRTKQYVKQLALNEDQKKAVYEAELEYIKADQSFRVNGQDVPPGPAYQMMMTHDQKFKAALTADQYAKYDKSRAVAAPGMTPQGNAQPTH